MQHSASLVQEGQPLSAAPRGGHVPTRGAVPLSQYYYSGVPRIYGERSLEGSLSLAGCKPSPAGLAAVRLPPLAGAGTGGGKASLSLDINDPLELLDSGASSPREGARLYNTSKPNLFLLHPSLSTGDSRTTAYMIF